ncbi:MAG TPA: LPS export ABC transporter permease LptG [Burkholderiaceae bacterium]|nr:LPS export ABC transporter permease LptG [Burkholderiaceae bacterium]
MRTARRYLAREIYRTSAVVLLALVSLFSFFALIEELDHVGSKFSLRNLFYLEGLATPSRVYDLLPIGLLIGAILALASLAQRHELVILRVSGVSGLRLLLTLWTITLPLVAGAFLLSEVITPTAEIKSSEASLNLLGKAGGGRLQSGYWFKEEVDNQTRMINIQQLQSAGGVSHIALYEFNPDRSLKAYSEAQTGQFKGHQLTLNDVTELSIDNTAVQALADAQAPGQPLVEQRQLDSRVLTTSLTAERLIARVLTPERMSIVTLLDYIAHLKENHIETDRQRVALWRKAAYPFTLLVMITIAAPISLMQTRRGGVGGKVFIGILLGVAFFMVNQLALNVGMLTRLPAWFTALGPNMGAGLLALGSFILMEHRHQLRALGQRFGLGNRSPSSVNHS